MKVRIAPFAALFGCLAAYAGEIVIVQPAEKDPRSIREPSRSERELGRTMDKARSYGRGGGAAPVVIDDSGGSRPKDMTEQAIRDAQDYLRPGSGAAAGGSGGTTVILRAAPPSETEKLRAKARSYVAADGAPRAGKNCGEVVNAVGIVGDGAASERSVSINVIEKGNSAVNINCK